MNKIQKYLRNEMQAEEKRLFEEEVRKDTSLKKEVLFQAKLFRALQLHENQGVKQENVSRAWINDLEKQAKAKVKPVFFVKNWQAVAALFVLAFGGILTYYLMDKQPNKEIIVHLPAHKDTLDIVKNGVANSEEKPPNLPTTGTNPKNVIASQDTEKQRFVKEKPKTNGVANKNAEVIALLQHNIDIKKEIVRYQDSILRKTQKSVYGFLANKTLKWEWKTDSLAQRKWEIEQKTFTTFYTDSLKKEKDALLEELAAYKEMNRKL